ncbi:hypothetical protein Ancab_000268 [Ancistrocladus abbreviatus]
MCTLVGIITYRLPSLLLFGDVIVLLALCTRIYALWLILLRIGGSPSPVGFLNAIGKSCYSWFGLFVCIGGGSNFSAISKVDFQEYLYLGNNGNTKYILARLAKNL